MQKPLLVLDPGHGGSTSFFYDLDNGVKLPFTWEEAQRLDPADKSYFSASAYRRWKSGQSRVEPRFYFERNGRRITYGDPGDLSPLDPRICEKDLVLDVARSLHQEIGRRLRVKMTRVRDGYVAMSSRIEYANGLRERQPGSAVFLSLHTATSNDVEKRGFRIRRTSETPERLVEILEEELTTHARELGMRRAGCEVVDSDSPLLSELDLPGAIVVLGFLSNLEDARRLLDRHLRHELARRLAGGLLEYLSRPEDPMHPMGETLGPPDSPETAFSDSRM